MSLDSQFIQTTGNGQEPNDTACTRSGPSRRAFRHQRVDGLATVARRSALVERDPQRGQESRGRGHRRRDIRARSQSIDQRATDHDGVGMHGHGARRRGIADAETDGDRDVGQLPEFGNMRPDVGRIQARGTCDTGKRYILEDPGGLGRQLPSALSVPSEKFRYW